MPLTDSEARKEQAYIDANKKFIICARKMAQIAYGKIDVKPDPTAPLKRAIGIYHTAWYDIHLLPKVREIKKRKYDTQDWYIRYQYIPVCVAVVYRETQDYHGSLQLTPIFTESLGKLNSRSPKHFLQQLHLFEEMIDNTIKNADKAYDLELTKKKLINDARKEIKGLVYRGGEWYIGEHEVSDSNYSAIYLDENGTINMRRLTLTVSQFNELTKILGWRKEESNA
ncbi:MAG: hypothetical protein HXY30_21145 [Pseudorhodoplanes sp.]|nr:hypothetical protein [Pseudorhodoplanes sp.]